MRQIDPLTALEPPFDRGRLSSLADKIAAVWGINCSRTLDWLCHHRNSESLRRDLIDAWSASTLPLRDWAQRVESVVAICDVQQCLLGIGVRLNNCPTNWVLQQSPISRDEAVRSVTALFEDPLEPIVQILAVAPGLTSERGNALAHIEFFSQPMDTMAGGGLGRVANAIRADVEVFSTRYCACELVWRRRDQERDFVVLDYSCTPFIYAEEVTPRLREVDMTASQIIAAYFEQPDQCFRRYIHSMKQVGRQIDWHRAGEDARRRFRELNELNQRALALAISYWGLRGRDSSPIWNEVERILRACTNAFQSRIGVGDDVKLIAHGLGRNVIWFRKPYCHHWFIPSTYVSFILYDLIASCDDLAAPLRYPDFRLSGENADAERVYDKVIEFLALLSDSQQHFHDKHIARIRFITKVAQL